MITVWPIRGVPEVQEGADLAALIVAALDEGLADRDVVVVTQKVVSKAEGRLRADTDKGDAVSLEAVRILRRAGDMVIAETRHGFVCANAGVDASNVPEGKVALLPVDPDASARRLRARIGHLTGRDVGVVVSDTFGRAWRQGQTDVAIGVAGFHPFVDYIGTKDTQGRTMNATKICVADQIAGAAEMVMGKADEVCAAVVRGAPIVTGRGEAVAIVRPHEGDLFR